MPVNSDFLGFAFEPEQRFENPDGSSIMLDVDYFGRKRGIHPVSGTPGAGEGDSLPD